ncbi:MAG: hypothetical protein MJ237_01430 [bacterium]|nr:hypothetical protein [bacterium]
MSKSLYLGYRDKMLAFPLWIKQTIYLDLSKDLNTYLSSEFLDVAEGELFHVYKPELSSQGQNELFTKESKFDESIYSFLNCCNKGMSLIEIAIENNFTMEEVSKAFTFCKTSRFFSKDVPALVAAIAGFIAGKYRTGEYFIRAGKMTIEQLDQVLNKQQEMNDSGKHVFIAELMVQMGFVRELDVKSIIFMKEEAGKRFSLNSEELPSIALEKESFDIRVENTKLKEENDILKQKMDALLTFIKEHKAC